MISSTTTKHVYNGDGVTKNWPYTFPILDPDDIEVYFTDATGAITLITTNYTVDQTNVYVTYPVTGAAKAVGTSITLVRVVPLLQEVDWKNNGAFNAEDLEESLDRLTMQIQQNDEALSRAVKFPIDETPTATDTDDFLANMDASEAAALAAAAAALVSQNAAASSATASATSATGSATSATASAASAAAAAISATAAASSATAAAGSATTATTQASNAATSATSSATQATNSSNSAGAAATSATASAASATTATTQATNSANSASAAATSATAAASSATAAAGSATAAAASAAAAAQSAIDASAATKLPLAGGTMTGAIAMGGNKVTGAGAATANGDLVRYEQALRLVGGTMSGDIAMGTSKVTGLGAATANGDALRYEQALRLVGGTMSGAIAMGASKITGLAAASANGDAVRFEQLVTFQTVKAHSATQTLTTSGTYQATNLLADITPTSSSHRVKITVSGVLGTSNSSCRATISIFRNGSDIDPSSGKGFAFFETGTGATFASGACSFVDSPASTSLLTYRVYIKSSNANNAIFGYDSSMQVITLEEIA